MSRILRCFVCLVLIGCILFNLSPLKVHAIDPVTFAGVSVAGSIVAASIIQGVGVLPVDSEHGAFGTLVNNCVSFLESTSNFVADGSIRVTGVLNATGGRTAFVPLALVQSVWEWLTDSGTVTNKLNSGSASASFEGTNYQVTADFPFGLIAVWYAGTTYDSYARLYAYELDRMNHLGGKLYVNGSSRSPAIASGNTNYYLVYGISGIKYYDTAPTASVRVLKVNDYGSLNAALDSVAGGSNYIVPDGLSLGDYESPYNGGEYPILLQDAPVYAPWASAITKIPSYSNSDEEIDGIPVSIPGSFESVLGQTQTGAQAGTNDLTWADSDTGTDSGTSTGTIADVITHIKSLGVSFADSIAEVVASVKAIPAAIADIFTPSAEIGHFALDLKNFFPFCIPFDLYDFFVCLNADPVAPVIDWEIYLPGGDTYPLKLDLAVFDDVAQLLRTLQLLLFCVGLAAKTRDLIKG